METPFAVLALSALLTTGTLAQAPADTTISMDETIEQLSLSLQELQKALGPMAQAADPRVETALDQLELSYSLTDDNTYKMTLNVGDNRTHLLFVNSRTETYQNTEIREIWAPAYRSAQALQPHLANRLLKDSYQKKMGAWQTSQSDGIYYVTFVAKIPVDLDLQSLGNILVLVVETADEMERELSDEDHF